MMTQQRLEQRCQFAVSCLQLINPQLIFIDPPSQTLIEFRGVTQGQTEFASIVCQNHGVNPRDIGQTLYESTNIFPQ